MPNLTEKTIDKLEAKVDFNQVYDLIRFLDAARGCLHDGVEDGLERIKDMLDAPEDADSDDLFDTANDIQSDIMTAQEHLEKIYEVLSDIESCWLDPDEEYKDDEDED
jgi:DNA-binding transcriptional regulator GbsR (MarR family)